MDRNIIIVIAAAVVALATWLLISFNQQPAMPELEPPTPSSLPGVELVLPTDITLYDFGDAPEYDPDNPETQQLYNGYDIAPTFPTAISFEGDTWYISHDQPQSQIFLGELASAELEPEMVNRDDDDGLLTERLQPCIFQSVELNVTVPVSYRADTPLYLNGLFDWTQNGAWAGESDACGFDVPEWGIQNVRLDQDPYNLVEPGIYTIRVPVSVDEGGNVWSRFTVTVEPVIEPSAAADVGAVAQREGAPMRFATVSQQGTPLQVALAAYQPEDDDEWHGQGQFGPGETEDYILTVLAGQQGLPVPAGFTPPAGPNGPPVITPNPNDPTPPTTPKGPPLEEEEQEKQSKEKKDKQKGNNGLGNGVDPQPPGNPPPNDEPGTGPGNPGNKGGPKNFSEQTQDQTETGKDKTPCNAGQGNDDEAASDDCPQGDPGNSAANNQGGDEDTSNPGQDKKDDDGDDSGGDDDDNNGKGKGKG